MKKSDPPYPYNRLVVGLTPNKARRRRKRFDKEHSKSLYTPKNNR